MIEKDSEGGLNGFVRRSIRHVFTRVPVNDNYFWRVYLTGSYTPDCCPGYLKERNFSIIRERAHRLRKHTCSLKQFLRDNPGRYSHFVLLDHQDWLAGSRQDLLEEEWKLILNNSRPGARILFRSAGYSNDFLPDFVFDRVTFSPEATDRLHAEDRVGTYGSVHLATVQ